MCLTPLTSPPVHVAVADQIMSDDSWYVSRTESQQVAHDYYKSNETAPVREPEVTVEYVYKTRIIERTNYSDTSHLNIGNSSSSSSYDASYASKDMNSCGWCVAIVGGICSPQVGGTLLCLIVILVIVLSIVLTGGGDGGSSNNEEVIGKETVQSNQHGFRWTDLRVLLVLRSGRQRLLRGEQCVIWVILLWKWNCKNGLLKC